MECSFATPCAALSCLEEGFLPSTGMSTLGATTFTKSINCTEYICGLNLDLYVLELDLMEQSDIDFVASLACNMTKSNGDTA